MAARRTAFTLIEAIVIVVILGAMAFIAVPRLNFAVLYRKQAHTVAKQIVTDLRRTRTMAICNAATDPNGFALSISGSTCQIINEANDAVVDSQTISTQIICGGGTYFHFGPLGNLQDDSSVPPQLAVSDRDASRTYTI